MSEGYKPMRRRIAAGGLALVAALSGNAESAYGQNTELKDRPITQRGDAGALRTSDFTFYWDQAMQMCFGLWDADGSVAHRIPGDGVIDIIYQLHTPPRFEERSSNDGSRWLWPVPVAIYTPVVTSELSRLHQGYIISGGAVSPSNLNNPWFRFGKTTYSYRGTDAPPSPRFINARPMQVAYSQNRNSPECWGGAAAVS